MNEAFYFRHDYNARNDGKLLKLRAKFGNEAAYGLFWMIVETMAESDDGSINGSAIDELSLSFGVDEERIGVFLEYCIQIGLFQDVDGRISSPRMAEHKKFRKERSESGKLGASKRWKNGSGLAEPMAEDVAEGMQRTGKERKEKKTTTSGDSKKSDDVDDAITKHLKSLGVQNPNAYLLSIKRKINYNADAIAKAWREWKSGGINSKSQFYDRCLHHAGVAKAA